MTDLKDTVKIWPFLMSDTLDHSFSGVLLRKIQNSLHRRGGNRAKCL